MGVKLSKEPRRPGLVRKTFATCICSAIDEGLLIRRFSENDARLWQRLNEPDSSVIDKAEITSYFPGRNTELDRERR